MFRRITKLAAMAALAVGALTAPMAVPSVHAATIQAWHPATTRNLQSNPATGVVAQSAIPAFPAATGSKAVTLDPWNCGWHPANDANAPGYLVNGSGGGAYLFSGPDADCSPIYYPLTFNGDYVIVHCGADNTRLGIWYDYLTDVTQGVTGWAADGAVNWRPYGGRPDQC